MTDSERELVPWKPSDGIVMEDLTSGSTRNWDQFAVNRDKFGVTTTWDERIYTTDWIETLRFIEKISQKQKKLQQRLNA
jgi:PAB1-binding protein PBP1